MAYINTGINRPGIVELMMYKPSTGHALSNLAHALLIEDSPLSSGDRELIASYVSYLNECEFCHLSHSAAANAHFGDEGKMEDIQAAKSSGANDEEIHDTVLIAAAFCMYNRYVDGLGTTPANKEEYSEMGKRMTKGYKMS